jgi:hypothetical protein
MHKVDPNSHAPRYDIVYATCFHVAAQFREVENVVHRFNKRCPARLDGVQERSLAMA